MYRQSGQSYIPLRVNSAGMIPLIFAFSIIIFPSVIAGWITGTAGDDTATQAVVQVPFAEADAADLTLAESYGGIAEEGTFRVNDAEITYAPEATFQDVLDDINQAAAANVLTTIETEVDPGSGDTVPVWRVENNALGQSPIVLEDVEGDFIARTQIPTHLEPPTTSTPLTPSRARP